jgi:hypothetical protein
VDRLMLLTVKEEGESKESKYFWHISISFYSDSAKIGIIFDTNNFFAKKIVSEVAVFNSWTSLLFITIFA